ncbi:MAG: MarC family protein [Dehalococcoidales bacterium]|nr:MarC family protein [Dehalococcoidales bacterium]
MNFTNHFVMTFVPLFIVLDALGNLPFVIALSEGMSGNERRKLVHVAILGATVVGLAFQFFGKVILTVLNINVGSFAVGGGIILLVLSINYMTSDRMIEVGKHDSLAIVPIGTPLLVGPATITTLLLLSTQFNLGVLLLSFILNMVVSWVIFLLSDEVTRLLGRGGLKVVSKVFDLLLAGIAVNMIIRGMDIVGIFKLVG